MRRAAAAAHTAFSIFDIILITFVIGTSVTAPTI
jgi:hypothetical protein